MVIKRGFIVAFVIALLLISGCKGGKFKLGKGEPSEEPGQIAGEKYSGTLGLELEFLPELPPDTIYDTIDELTVYAEIRNKGAFRLENAKAKAYLTGYDPSILPFEPNVKSLPPLEPKTQYTEGDIYMAEFAAKDVRSLPEGTDRLPVDLSLVTCYSYQTRANPVVCIDPNRPNLIKSKDACTPESVSLSGGQGAPVAVNRVDVETAGRKTFFKVNIQNVGGGEVVDAAKCPFTLGYENVNKVGYTIKLKDKSVTCKPNSPVRLNNGQATITCSYEVAQEEMFAYQTPLLIELNYGYMQSVTRKLEIVNIEE